MKAGWDASEYGTWGWLFQCTKAVLS